MVMIGLGLDSREHAWTVNIKSGLAHQDIGPINSSSSTSLMTKVATFSAEELGSPSKNSALRGPMIGPLSTLGRAKDVSQSV